MLRAGFEPATCRFVVDNRIHSGPQQNEMRLVRVWSPSARRTSRSWGAIGTVASNHDAPGGVALPTR
jgi:hypothetical protein